MGKAKFWQKVCGAIFAAFLLCMVLVCSVVYFSGKRQSYQSELSVHLSRQEQMLEQFSKDIAALQSRNSNALTSLYKVYGEQYRKAGAELEVYDSGEVQFSNLPKGAAPAQYRQELDTQPGTRTYLVYETPQGRRLFVAVGLPDYMGRIVVVYSADLEQFYAQWDSILRLLVLAGVSATVLFGGALYLLLYRMYQPLAKVTRTAGELGSGNLSARAEVQRRDEFGELALALNTMADTVEEQMTQLKRLAEQRQRLIENMAHELRTPIAVISGWAETMRTVSLTEEEQAEALDIIAFESRRMTNLSRQMLELSVLRHDGTLQMQPVSVEELLEHTRIAVLPLAKNRGVELTIEQPGFSTVQGDSTLLESLLGNLCENAIKASKPGGRVRLTTDNNGGKRFLVRDEGRGMTPETVKNLGQPFYREDKARSRQEGGAGLGVALCFEIARQHGAELNYLSKPGAGTLAIVKFPDV